MVACFRSKGDSGSNGDKAIRPEDAIITLPISYDPVSMLDQLETQFNFSMKATHTKLESESKRVSFISKKRKTFCTGQWMSAAVCFAFF